MRMPRALVCAASPCKLLALIPTFIMCVCVCACVTRCEINAHTHTCAQLVNTFGPCVCVTLSLYNAAPLVTNDLYLMRSAVVLGLYTSSSVFRRNCTLHPVSPCRHDEFTFLNSAKNFCQFFFFFALSLSLSERIDVCSIEFRGGGVKSNWTCARGVKGTEVIFQSFSQLCSSGDGRAEGGGGGIVR